LLSENAKFDSLGELVKSDVRRYTGRASKIMIEQVQKC